MSNNKITVTAVVSAKSNLVWNYYTQPEHIVKWNFASDDWQCPSASNDMKVGGLYKARMEAKDGSFGFDFEAIYDEINEGNSFTYTMLDGRKANVEFIERDGATEVNVTFDPEGTNSLDMQRQGWQTILDNFKKYAESMPSAV